MSNFIITKYIYNRWINTWKSCIFGTQCVSTMTDNPLVTGKNILLILIWHKLYRLLCEGSSLKSQKCFNINCYISQG